MARGVDARRIAYSLADAQLGMLTRGQLRRNLLSGNLVDRWIRSGHLLRCLPGVYALGRPADSIDSLWMAGILFGGEASALAGSSAAHAWGMSDGSKRIDVVRKYGVHRKLCGNPPHGDSEFAFRRGSLEPDDVVHLGPIRLMDPARTLIDLAGKVAERRLRRYFIEAGREGLLTPRCLSRIESRSHGFTGRKRLLALKSNWDPSTGRIRSILEGEFKLLCAERGLPSPLTNQRVGGYEVDALWEDARLIVELDGRKFHSDAVALVTDSAKARDLRNLGYRVLRFTWNDVVERPEWVASEIRRHLGSACPRIGGVN